MIRLTIDKYLEKSDITRYELAKRTDVKFQTQKPTPCRLFLFRGTPIRSKFCENILTNPPNHGIIKGTQEFAVLTEM